MRYNTHYPCLNKTTPMRTLCLLFELLLQLALLGVAGLFLTLFGGVWLWRRRPDRGEPRKK